MNTKTIYIDGMQCNHCKMRVENALKEIEGITSVNVSLDDKLAIIEFTDIIDEDRIIQAIDDIGFTVKEIK